MTPLAGKVALVTGAGRGIGRGIAMHLAMSGAKLVLTSRTAGELEDLAAEIRAGGGVAMAVTGSVSDPVAADAMVDAACGAFGRLDILVNNAGIVEDAAFLDITIESWRRVIDTNLTGCFLMTQRAARRMKDHGGGSIVNIASIDAQGYDGPQASYVASKAGIIGLTRDAATALAPFGIRVNSVSPGWVRTRMIEDFLTPDQLDYMLHRFERVPMRRLVEIGEVAAAVAFLASDAAAAITGIDIPVDGGTLATLNVYETLPR
ncbi:2-deoxy-D-gluconate 3-dehydrogenase [Tistrella bauzanensis]|uniref:2-deoxy-D-gluconate 3-dehydrogenase n=1 Tax=Tistrella bauzanensis TaxID=657419 RepID=A0ABQ1JCD8_9PROT|nr:glucose 1-dehydrogenase [Tistrella bauzanensis]GGB62766.1 2-deoxy-D-gluconate 3-dehydrogenase [Tistrella bauzanensis]